LLYDSITEARILKIDIRNINSTIKHIHRRATDKFQIKWQMVGERQIAHKCISNCDTSKINNRTMKTKTILPSKFEYFITP